MLTDKEFTHPYLWPGVLLIGPSMHPLLAAYMTLVLERKVQVEEVADAIERQLALQAAECAADPDCKTWNDIERSETCFWEGHKR